MRKLIAPVLLAVAMGTSIQANAAAAVQADCGFNTVAQEDLTGGQTTFTGAAYGYAVSDVPGEEISVSCQVRVNGGTVDSTDPGALGQASFTGGQVTYTKADTDTVTLCVVWTGDVSGEICSPTTTQEIPPDAVFELLDQIFQIIADATAPTDPLVCGVIRDTLGLPPILNSLTAITGIWIDPDDCDIWLVRDTPIFICPARIIDFVPYGDAPHANMPACFFP